MVMEMIILTTLTETRIMMIMTIVLIIKIVTEIQTVKYCNGLLCVATID